MKRRRVFRSETKKRRLLQKPAQVAEVLGDFFDREFDADWRDEKTRRLDIREWRRFKHQAF